MISNLLTAVGVAVLSMQTPTARPTAEPMRAYYNSSSIADYGTDRVLYNYTGHLIWIDGDPTGAIPTNNIAMTVVTEGYYSISDPNEDYGYGHTFVIDEGDYVEPLDLYMNGEFFVTLVPENTLYTLPQYHGEETHNTEFNAWLFEHETPMSQTIIETAGDATTAAATVIGAGFTGVINLFYNDGITGLGILALIGLGVSLVWFALALILRLWRGRR